MKTSKKKIVSTLFLGLIAFSLFISLFSMKGQSALADIDYTFENDNMFNSTSLGRPNPFVNDTNTFNVRERETITGHFNATYSFENEIEGTSEADIDFIDSGLSDVDCNVSIVSEWNGHDKIILFLDESTTGGAEAIHEFGLVYTDATYEFWWSSSDISANKYLILQLRESTNIIISLQFEVGNFRNYDGGWDIIKTGCSADTWYHHRLLLDDTTNTFDWYINGVLEGDDLDYNVNSVIGIDDYHFGTHTAEDGGKHYLDAFGYSWDTSYDIGDNVFPYSNVSDINQYEVNEWQFRYNPITRTQYVDGSDDPSGWNDFGDSEPAVDDVNTLNLGASPLNPPKDYQRYVVVHIEEDGGLYRDFGGINDTYYNLTFNFQINDFDDTDVGANHIVMYIRDSDDASYLTYLILWYNGDIQLYYDGGSSVIDTFTPVGNYTVTFLLNIRSQIQQFYMYDWNNGSLLTDFTAPFYNDTAGNIDRIIYYHSVTTSEVDSYLMSISLYDTTGSVSDDVGEIDWDNVAQSQFDGFDGNWFFNEFNLISLLGNFINASVFVNEVGGIIYALFMDWSSINNSVFLNAYDDTNFVSYTFSDLRVWMYNNFSFTSISIDGVKLTEGTNSYRLEFTNSSQIDISESYFNVVNNQLKFTLNCENTDLEYIQAEFNINDVSSNDFAIKFSSEINNLAFGFFRIKFLDISNYVPIEFSQTITRFFITQGKTIDSFIFIITDDDVNATQGITSGFISNVELISVSGVSITILTSDLLGIMIPIIMIFIPTFLLASRFGKNTIVPLMLLMSLVCMVTEIIPLWLFFIIVFPSALFIFLKRGEGLF